MVKQRALPSWFAKHPSKYGLIDRLTYWFSHAAALTISLSIALSLKGYINHQTVDWVIGMAAPMLLIRLIVRISRPNAQDRIDEA